MNKKYLKMSIIIFILVLVDQIAKQIMINKEAEILTQEKIDFVKNYGGAFGIGENSTLFFIIVTIVILGIIIKFIYSQRDRIDIKTLASLTLIIAGGFSNLIDRVTRGWVVDYIDVTRFFKFPMFNLADVYVVVGWVMLFVAIIIYWNHGVKAAKQR